MDRRKNEQGSEDTAQNERAMAERAAKEQARRVEATTPPEIKRTGPQG